MKQYLTPLLLALALGTGAAYAQDKAAPQQDKPQTAQQSRMTQCNKDAAERKGDERKAFMSECLKNKPVAATPQERMKACNVQAKDKKGDERKAFMSECLKKKA